MLSISVLLNSVQGIEYVRPPTLDFLKVKDNEDYTEYKVITKKNSKKKAQPKKGCPENPFTNYLDSFIFCNPTLNIQIPKKNFMIKDGKKKFAYAVGMFPNPKNGKAAYLDGCILAALGIKRQGTNADVICFITPDINEKDKKLEETISAVLEDFASYSTNISSDVARKMIAKQIIKKINKMYELNIKYYYT